MYCYHKGNKLNCRLLDKYENFEKSIANMRSKKENNLNQKSRTRKQNNLSTIFGIASRMSRECLKTSFSL